MAIDALKRALVFIVLCLVQVLVFNHIHLFGFATVLIYVYFVIMFPRNYPRWAGMLWGFALGLFVDMFANTQGVTAAALTLTAFIQPYLLELFIPREATENMKSAVSTLGFWKFFMLTFALAFVQCLLVFTLESFGFFNWQQWLLNIGGSTLLTVAMIMTIESVRK